MQARTVMGPSQLTSREILTAPASTRHFAHSHLNIQCAKKMNLSVPERAATTATLCALAVVLAGPSPAMATDPVEPVYFGNGCFWGRQYDFVNAEKSMGRKPGDLSAIAGYAGGRLRSPSGKVR